MRTPHPKAIVVGLLSAGLVFLAGYFIVMDRVFLPRAEATLDRVQLHLEPAPRPLGVGKRGMLFLSVDNRANHDSVRLRDALLSPSLADVVRFDGETFTAQGAVLDGPRVVWNREISGGGSVDLPLTFYARKAGRYEGAVLVLLDVPRMTKGRSLPLTIEVR